MPDPTTLKVGDKIRFTGIPDEWGVPGMYVDPDDVAFMKVMIGRTWPSRIYRIDDDGCPWIRAYIREGDQAGDHDWKIFEKTGWRLIGSRC